MRLATVRTILLVASVALLTACGGDDQVSAPPGASGDTASPAADRLQVEVDLGDGSTPQTWTLTCSPPGGDHPDPEGACADLAAAPEPFLEPDPDQMCTEQYGGPQTAAVTGTWDGQAVDTTFDRVNGCAISRWDAVGRLLPAAPGTALEEPLG